MQKPILLVMCFFSLMLSSCAKVVIEPGGPPKILYHENAGFPSVKMRFYDTSDEQNRSYLTPSEVAILWGYGITLGWGGEGYGTNAFPDKNGVIIAKDIPARNLSFQIFIPNAGGHYHAEVTIPESSQLGHDIEIEIPVFCNHLRPCTLSHCPSYWLGKPRKLHWWNREWWTWKNS